LLKIKDKLEKLNFEIEDLNYIESYIESKDESECKFEESFEFSWENLLARFNLPRTYEDPVLPDGVLPFE